MVLPEIPVVAYLVDVLDCNVCRCRFVQCSDRIAVGIYTFDSILGIVDFRLVALEAE